MRYRLDVVAPSVPEVVKHAGGWLVDRVMAGWDVTVLIDGEQDLRPLEILGVDTQDLETALSSAGATVSSQHATVDDLQVCLTGVEQALNALAVGDQTHALSALQVVSGACNSVSAADG